MSLTVARIKTDKYVMGAREAFIGWRELAGI